MDRRAFLAASATFLAGCTGTAASPVATYPKPGSIPGPGVTVGPADTSIDAGEIDFAVDRDRDRLVGYRARPRGNGPFPGVLLLHDTRGLSEHMRDVARRLAKNGYLALAIDFLSRVGGTDSYGEVNAVTAQLNRITADRALTDCQAAVQYLLDVPFIKKGAVATVGFDWGGTQALSLAGANKAVQGTAVWYAPNPPLDRLRGVAAPVFAIYGENDDRLREGIGPLEEALKKANVPFEAVIEPGASRGFHHELNQAYNLPAAQDAWARTVGFLERRIKS